MSIRIENISKHFHHVEALRHINLTLERGEQYAISGASGSGKSTLMYLLGGLDVPTEGEIWVGEHSLSRMNDHELAVYRNRYVGFVFQFHFLLPSMSCLNNILLPSKIGGLSSASVKDHALHLAKELGVEHCLKKYPYQLSGGEQQRINIIRALSLKPKLLLCDEPTGNLDSANSQKVTQLLKDLAHQFSSTLVVVTHDQQVAQTMTHRIVIRDGQILG